jgi:hypothetical protein
MSGDGIFLLDNGVAGSGRRDDLALGVDVQARAGREFAVGAGGEAVAAAFVFLSVSGVPTGAQNQTPEATMKGEERRGGCVAGRTHMAGRACLREPLPLPPFCGQLLPVFVFSPTARGHADGVADDKVPAGLCRGRRRPDGHTGPSMVLLRHAVGSVVARVVRVMRVRMRVRERMQVRVCVLRRGRLVR